jgi:hypothetical protein
MNRNILKSCALGIFAGAASAGAQTFVSADVTSDTTWSLAGSPYILEDIIYVTGGTLKIDAGVVVRGQPRSAAGFAGAPGSLVVTKDGMIDAVGTATLPIIFTTAAIDVNDDGIADANGDFFAPYTGSEAFLDDSPLADPLPPLDGAGEANIGLWGGVVVLGEAPTNLAVGLTELFAVGEVEGLPSGSNAEYGGVFPNDNSGKLSYVSIRHGGDKIGDANEINGLTLAGVGFGTQLDHIEIYCNFDDGIEWFGGTCNMKYAIVSFVGDDSFDADQGFTGLSQFLFAVTSYFPVGDNDGDKGFEFDGHDGGDGDDLNELAFANYIVYNATVLGNSGTTKVGGVSDNGTLRLRNGYGGGIFNSIIVNTGSQEYVDCDNADGSGSLGEDFDTTTNFANGFITFDYNLMKDGAGVSDKADVSHSTGFSQVSASLVAAGTNNVLDPATWSGLTAEDQSSVGGVNPTPAFAFGTIVSGTADETATFFSDVGYKGAFPNDSVTTFWTTGWTALNRSGVLVDRGDGFNVDGL